MFPPRAVLGHISRAKDELITPEDFMSMHSGDFRMSKIGRLYKHYLKQLVKNKALDFDDIIMNTVRLLKEHEDVLDYYQRKFTHVLVDEYQDTNTSQYILVSLLAQGHRNLCVVGDDDQSIYKFRGANIRNILDFESQFHEAITVKLEQNYRSTQTILNSANEVISNNIGRKGKELWTDNGEGEKIKLFEGCDEYDEGSYIVQQIQYLKEKLNKKYSDFAILYRMNAQSRVLEERLMREGLPYRIFGGIMFYERREIKDIIAYLRLIQNLSDDISLKRVINEPKRGIGKTTIDVIQTIAIEKGTSMFEVVSHANDFPKLARAQTKLKEFQKLIDGLNQVKDGLRVTELLNKVFEQTGYIKLLESDESIEAQTRIENLKEFISTAVEYDRSNEEGDLRGFLENISLVTDIDNYNEEEDSVLLMTLHSAKGLEFPVVFLCGMEEGVFPSYRSIVESEELEEERRLCYVGITRAKEALYITYATCRTMFGSTTYNSISRFVNEIPNKFFDNKADDNNIVSQSIIGYDTNINSYDSQIKSFNRTIDSLKLKNRTSVIEKYSVGDTVTHKKFGEGMIISVNGSGEKQKLEIAFKEVGTKILATIYTKLGKV